MGKARMTQEEKWVVIAIGRNRLNDPTDILTSRQWDRFRLDVDASFVGGRPDFHVTGVSHSHEHGHEETYLAGGTVATSVADIRAWLAVLAARYAQTAISLTVGGSERITPLRHDFPGYGASCRACGLRWHPVREAAACIGHRAYP